MDSSLVRVAMTMSGGVDSSVAAALLKRTGLCGNRRHDENLGRTDYF
jgi:asparagine synthetase B (glutamine-hydrolysing)